MGTATPPWKGACKTLTRVALRIEAEGPPEYDWDGTPIVAKQEEEDVEKAFSVDPLNICLAHRAFRINNKGDEKEEEREVFYFLLNEDNLKFEKHQFLAKDGAIEYRGCSEEEVNLEIHVIDSEREDLIPLEMIGLMTFLGIPKELLYSQSQ